MKRFLALSIGLTIAGAGVAMAAGETMSSIPGSSVTVTDWYKQDVYDTQNHKIGSIEDVLVSPDGKVDVLILSVHSGDVAVKPDAVQKVMKNGSVYLTMNTSNDAFKSAATFKYDKNTTSWVLDTSQGVNH